MSTNDTSIIHNIDLEYLINPDQHKKMAEKYEENLINEDEKKFYRKRMLQLTRDLIAGDIQNSNLESAFNSYMQESIKYFKFMDKKDIIQGEYKELNDEIKKRKERKMEKIRQQELDNKKSYPEKQRTDTDVNKIDKKNSLLTGKSVDELLINKSQLKDPSMNSFIKIKKNRIEQNHIMPKKKEIDLTDPKLKKKGIKKKRKKEKTDK